jgi:hypothetical protein
MANNNGNNGALIVTGTAVSLTLLGLYLLHEHAKKQQQKRGFQ